MLVLAVVRGFPALARLMRLPRNFNGEQLRELHTKQHMVAANTFFPAGDTYFGNFGHSRIHVATSGRAQCLICARQMSAAHSQQLASLTICRCSVISGTSYVFRQQLFLEPCDSTSGRDRDALAQGVLQGFKREQFLAECEEELGKMDVSCSANQPPDAIWGVVNAAVLHEGKSCYTVQRKHINDPADARQAHANMHSSELTLSPWHNQNGSHTCTPTPCQKILYQP